MRSWALGIQMIVKVFKKNKEVATAFLLLRLQDCSSPFESQKSAQTTAERLGRFHNLKKKQIQVS